MPFEQGNTGRSKVCFFGGGRSGIDLVHILRCLLDIQVDMLIMYLSVNLELRVIQIWWFSVYRWYLKPQAGVRLSSESMYNGEGIQCEG